jgi:2-aminobenzoate-CoA ligase
MPRKPSPATATLAASAHHDTFARDNLPPRGAWPQLLFSLPHLQYPKRMNAAAWLLDEALRRGWSARPAVGAMVDDKPVFATYAQLAHRANQIAHVLTRTLKLVPGNRVLLRGANTPMMAACWLAVVKAGLIAVATMPLLRAKELQQVIDKAQVQAALALGRRTGFLHRCQPSALLPQPDPGAPFQCASQYS